MRDRRKPAAIFSVEGYGKKKPDFWPPLANCAMYRPGWMIKQGNTYKMVEEHLAETMHCPEKKTEEKDILWLVGLGDWLSADSRPGIIDMFVGRLRNALSEIAGQPVVH